MAHLYEGALDARQENNIVSSRFRKRYRQLTEVEVALHDDIKEHAAALEALFEQVPPGRYRSLAFTALEEAIMWAVKELTA